MEIQNGEIICDKCGGRGILRKVVPPEYVLTVEDTQPHDHVGIKVKDVLCSRCLGERTLDWIENIVGKKASTIALPQTLIPHGGRYIVKRGSYEEMYSWDSSLDEWVFVEKR